MIAKEMERFTAPSPFLFPIKGDCSGEGKNFFSREKSFSLLPNPHPFSKKAKYFAAPLVTPQLAERWRIVAAQLTPMTTKLLEKYYLPIMGIEHFDSL